MPVLKMCLDKLDMEQDSMLRLLQQLASTETWSLRGDSHAAQQRQPWAILGKICTPVPAQKASRTCIRPSICPELDPASGQTCLLRDGIHAVRQRRSQASYGNLCKPHSLVKARHAS